MYKVIIYNKMNNIERFVFTKNVTDAIAKARRIAKAIAKKGGWTMVEKEDNEKIAFFDYTPF